MKFNLNDFLQLDANGLLAVNGGNSCSTSSSSSGSDSSSGTPNGSSPSPGGGSVTYNPNNTITYRQKNGQSFTYRTSGNSSSSGGGNCNGASDGKTVYSNPYYGENKGAGGSTSNNPNGQGASVTTTATTVGGSCSKTSDPKEPETPVSPTTIESGTFAQITDGSYADKLTMQYYVNNKDKYGVFTDFLDGSMNGKEELFSKKGCKMTAGAKIASEITGSEIGLYEVNTVWDTDKDGLLTKDEICKGLDNLLDDKFGDIYDVKASSIDNPTLKNLQSIADDTSGTTYVLGKAKDVHGSNHWVVLEGYKVNSDGSITFSYDGTSDNDAARNRSYVIGKSDTDNNIHNIVQIQTFTVYKK